jgi:hypothetical protein
VRRASHFVSRTILPVRVGLPTRSATALANSGVPGSISVASPVSEKALFQIFTMIDDQSAIYRRCTGRTAPPAAPATEAWFVCGRHAGKSFVLALVAVFLVAFHDYRPHLSTGERGTVIVIARDRGQAQVIMRYVPRAALRRADARFDA